MLNPCLEAAAKFMGTRGFLLWSYPPQFIFVAAGLALLPAGLSYLIFVSLSFVAYLLVLRHIASPYSSATLFAIAPALFAVIICGQNGFLTGSLAGLFFLAFLKNRSTAGVTTRPDDHQTATGHRDDGAGTHQQTLEYAGNRSRGRCRYLPPGNPCFRQRDLACLRGRSQRGKPDFCKRVCIPCLA